MDISEILSPERVVSNADWQSKKAALENIAELIAKADATLTRHEVFESLVARERLGSTGLGQGIALPHGRLKGTKQTLGAFVRLNSGIDYDATDQEPVDLLFALLVPQESTEEHLQILSRLAELFSHTEIIDKIRSEQNADNIYRLLTE